LGGTGKEQLMEILVFANPAEWRAWLEVHHASEQEAWVILYKKKYAEKGLTLAEAVEEALCFGWIDSVLKPIDEEKYALRYSPRKSRSVWSESNKQRVEKLIQEGRMTAAGMEKVVEAKANGEWDAATARENIDDLSGDLTEVLKKQAAWDNFAAWPVARKKMYLYWLNSAKKPETRRKRIKEIGKLAADNFTGGVVMDKAKLINELEEEFQSWKAFLNGLVEAEITAEQRLEQLSIKDIVAHLTAWQKITVARMEAGWQNWEPQYPEWPADFDTDSQAETDKINAWIYDMYQYQSWLEVYREWSERFKHIVEIANAIPENYLLESGKYPWLAGYPLSAVLTGTLEHHQEHFEGLQLLLERDNRE
jgi:uncharacterized protein YdeI (YjbR/CyaY-like superfamily)